MKKTSILAAFTIATIFSFNAQAQNVPSPTINGTGLSDVGTSAFGTGSMTLDKNVEGVLENSVGKSLNLDKLNLSPETLKKIYTVSLAVLQTAPLVKTQYCSGLTLTTVKDLKTCLQKPEVLGLIKEKLQSLKLLPTVQQ